MPSIKKILVPTDFSDNASSVYKYARTTAQNYGATVDFIHIVPRRLNYFSLDRDELGYIFEDKDKYARLRTRVIEKLQAEMDAHIPAENRGKVFAKNEDRAAGGIVEHAMSESYDLIIMAARGGHESKFTRGSVTEKVIRIATTPVVTVNRGYDPKINTIVVPTDTSNTSLGALPMAVLVADHREAAIHLTTVSKRDENKIKTGGEAIYKHVDEEMKEKVLKALQEFVDGSDELEFVNPPQLSDEYVQLKIKGGQVVRLNIIVLKGVSTHDSIASYARDHAQLVVMGTHGRSGLSYIFLGSTTEKVIRHLKLPVLTIKPKFVKKWGK